MVIRTLLSLQVTAIASGMNPAWIAEDRDSLGAEKSMPRTKEDMLERLSPEMKDLLQNPAYHQIQTPLTFDYPEVGEC